MPLTLVCHFWESNHPKLMASTSAFPRPLEWEFAEGDKVIIWPLWKPGIITSLLSDVAEVEVSNKDGIVAVSWLHIRKVIPVGEHVEITGGEYRGKKGWFDGIQQYTQGARVIVVEDVNNPLPDRITVNLFSISQIPCLIFIQILEAHVNLLKQIDAPFVLAKPSNALEKTQSDRVPWIRTEVIITGRHQLKTRRGIIVDVLCKQDTCSGLRVCLELTTLDPTSPFGHIVLDYDYIVEAKLVSLVS
jgi:hypothetical protein